MAWIGFFAYAITMATIDPCEMNSKLHGICSVVFFVLMIFYTIFNFEIIGKLREKDPIFISEDSWSKKKN